MAVTNFVPDIWSARILTNLSRTSVAGGICNRDYEGDTAVGDSVKITSIVDPTITAYTGADMTLEDIDDATRALLLDQKQSFNFYLDDVERAQSVNGGALMTEAIDRASYGLRNVLDAYVLSQIGAGASSTGPDHQIAEATISTATAAFDAIVDWSVLLDAADVPEENRFVVVTPAFHGKLLKDSRFIAAGDQAGAEVRANGRIGSAAGFDVYKSNNLPAGPGAGAGTLMIAGSRYATTLAEQVRKVEAYRVEKKFGDGVKGLHVYGAKVTRPTALVAADVIVS
jgi:hypothetical protein